MSQSWRRFTNLTEKRNTRITFRSPLERLLPYCLAGLAFLLLLSGCTGSSTQSDAMTHPRPTPTFKVSTPSSSGVAIRKFADTWDNIHLFLTFDYNLADPATSAKHYDFVWGAEMKNVTAFRSPNPGIFLTYYISFLRDTGTFGDKGAIHSLMYWKTTHPDWVLYQCDRVTPAYEFGDPDVPLNFADPEVLAWQVQTYARPASQNGYDGIAADNVNLQNSFGACGIYVHGKWVQLYTGQPDDPTWRNNVLTWLTRMHQALHHLQHPLDLIPNLSTGNLSPNDPIMQQVVNQVDGVLNEGGFSQYGDGYLTGSDWIQAIQFMESLQAQNKAYYLINQFHSIGHAEIEWAVASYLMGKEHSTAMFISTVQGYGGDFWDTIFDAPIGHPTGPMYQVQHVYARDYSNGLILVNPSATASYSVTLDTGDKFHDLYGLPVSGTVMMPPHSGMVLMNSS
jgi:Hypothetical glycosyl hydrolase family 15